MKKVKIGILAGPELSKYFTNGLFQNAWTLAKMLSFHKDFEVTMISKGKDNSNSILGVSLQAHSKEAILDKDLIICVAYSLSSPEALALKKAGKKFVLIHYGNCLITDLTKYCAFKSGKYSDGGVEWIRKSRKVKPDKVLYSPHYEFQKQYFAACSNSELKDLDVAPYVWSNTFIANSINHLNKSKKIPMRYNPKDLISKNLIFSEPSLNPSKTNLIPIMIADEVFKYDQNIFNKGYALSSKGMLTDSFVQDRLKAISVIREGKISFEKRLSMPRVMREVGRVLVSHQMLNALNYTYFEFALLNYPFVHNSEMLSEYGYYYEGNNVYDGKDQLINALNHGELSDKEREIYSNRCEDMIWKHSPLNKKNISKYIELVTSVL